MREIIKDINGVERFKINRLIRFLLDSNDNIDLDKIWKHYKSGLFNYVEMKEFYQLIGYSVEGFREIFSEE